MSPPPPPLLSPQPPLLRPPSHYGCRRLTWVVRCLITLLVIVLPSAASQLQDGGVCHLHNYVSSCILNILEEHIEATATINHCHVPLDITFLVVYQYRNNSRHSWTYTFVTSNQNERVLIPGLLLPSAPHAPVFLYARVPEKEFIMHNSSFVAIEASFIAELSHDQWEEAEFLNHTIFLSPSDDCHFPRDETDPIPWIIGGLFAFTLLFGVLGVGCYFYRKKKMAADQLALVSAMEVGVPGAQPYQMETVSQQTASKESSTQEHDAVERGTSTGEAVRSGNSEEPQQGASNGGANGRKGFKFGRLKEERSSQSRAAELDDSSVIIANPAYLDGSHKKHKKTGAKKQEQADQLSLSHDQRFTQGSGIMNKLYQEGADTLQQSNKDEEGNKVLHDTATAEEEPNLESDESVEDSSDVGQGARRKVRGAVSSSAMVSDKPGDIADSQKCL